MYSQRLQTLVTIVVLSVAALGCGKSERVAVHPVEGTLMLNGQPLAGAQVVFHPRLSQRRNNITAYALTDAQGNFKLTTYDAHDGAPEGPYAITVQLYRAVPRDDGYVPGPNLLPPRYAFPTTTDITVQIARGANKLPPLNLR